MFSWGLPKGYPLSLFLINNMIPVSFVHESLPAGGFRADMLSVPNREDIVRLNDQNFVVISVAHALDKGLEKSYCAFVYLLTVEEYRSQNNMMGSR